MRNFFLLLAFLSPPLLLAQLLHSPTDLWRLAEASTLRYTLDSTLDTKATSTWPVLPPAWAYTSQRPNSLTQSVLLETKAAAQKYQLKADKFFEHGQYSKAARNYEKAIAAQGSPPVRQLHERLSHCYLALEQSAEARQAIAPILANSRGDFELQLLLSELHRIDGNAERQRYHLGLAHLFNRNDGDILAQYRAQLREAQLEYRGWDFRPVYAVHRAGTGVRVQYGAPPWEASGLCTALWEHEPGYRERMSELSNQPPDRIQQKECLFNALIAYEQDGGKAEAYPGLATLARIVPDQQIDWFILYEIEARREPQILLSLAEEELHQLLGYIERYRCRAVAP